MNKYQNLSEQYFEKQSENLIQEQNLFFSDDAKINYMCQDSILEDSDQMLSLEQNFDILNLSYSQICNSISKRSITKCLNQNEEEALSKVHSDLEASLNSKSK